MNKISKKLKIKKNKKKNLQKTKIYLAIINKNNKIKKLKMIRKNLLPIIIADIH